MNPKNKPSYWQNLRQGIRTTLRGLRLSGRHLADARHRNQAAGQYVSDPAYFGQSTGTVTLRYPYEAIPVPDHGRYRLHNEMDDCIVCDKCAKVCPVDCIDIEPIKATEEVGRAADGSPIRLYAARFDIDMAKCCYCGLCTTVCPTECLTMTKTYDFSEFDIGNMNYHFANLSPDQAAEKQRLYEQFVAEKAAAKAQEVAAEKPAVESPKTVARPAFRPGGAKPAAPPVPTETSTKQPEDKEVGEKSEALAKLRPVFRPGMKAPVVPPELPAAEAAPPLPAPQPAAKPRPVFRPTPPKPPELPTEPS